MVRGRTMTASMPFCSSSFRQSVYPFAPLNWFVARARRSSSISQTATISFPGASSIMSDQPFPPTPIQAIATFRFGSAEDKIAGPAESPARVMWIALKNVDEVTVS